MENILKLTPLLKNELQAIVKRLDQFKVTAGSNKPTSFIWVIKTFWQDCLAYKVRLEELMEMTDCKDH